MRISAFLNYQKNWMSMQQKDGDLGKRVQNNKQNSDSVKILMAEQKAQEAKMISYLKTVIQENNGNLLSVLGKSNASPGDHLSLQFLLLSPILILSDGY